MRKVYELFSTLNGVVAAKAEQSLLALNIKREEEPDKVSEREADSIAAWLQAYAIRRSVGAYIYITVDDELAFWSGSPLRMHLGTRTGKNGDLGYVALSLIEQLKAIGLSSQWNAIDKTVVIA